MKIVVFLLFIGNCCFSQCDSLAIQQLFSKSQKLYATSKAYRVQTSYEVYKGLEDPILSLSGIMVKKANYLYNKMDTTERIQQKDKELTISHSEHMVSYKQGVPFSVKATLEVDQLLPYMDSYYVNKFSDGGYECELTPLPISGLPFDELIVTYRDDYSLESQEMLSYQKKRVKDSLGTRHVTEQTRIIFCYSALEGIQTEEKFPILSDYIYQTGNKVILKNKIKNYQLIDL